MPLGYLQGGEQAEGMEMGEQPEARLVEVPPRPAPYTLQPIPYTLHPTPYTLHLTPYTPHPTPYTLHPTPRLRRASSRFRAPSPPGTFNFCITLKPRVE